MLLFVSKYFLPFFYSLRITVIAKKQSGIKSNGKVNAAGECNEIKYSVKEKLIQSFQF